MDVSEQSLYLKINYGLREQTSLDVMVPYRAMEVDEIDFEEAGIGDLSLVVNQRIPCALELWTGLGVSLPTGDSDAMDGDGRLANESLQAGRGAAEALLSLSWLGRVGEPWLLYSDIRTRIALGENDSEYRQGAMIDTTVGSAYTVGAFDFFGDIFWAHAEPDERDGDRVRDSGGEMLFVTPGVRYWAMQRLAFTLKHQMLVADDVKGEQMLPSQITSLGLTILLGP